MSYYLFRKKETWKDPNLKGPDEKKIEALVNFCFHQKDCERRNYR